MNKGRPAGIALLAGVLGYCFALLFGSVGEGGRYDPEPREPGASRQNAGPGEARGRSSSERARGFAALAEMRLNPKERVGLQGAWVRAWLEEDSLGCFYFFRDLPMRDLGIPADTIFAAMAKEHPHKLLDYVLSQGDLDALGYLASCADLRVAGEILLSLQGCPLNDLLSYFGRCFAVDPDFWSLDELPTHEYVRIAFQHQRVEYLIETRQLPELFAKVDEFNAVEIAHFGHLLATGNLADYSPSRFTAFEGRNSRCFFEGLGLSHGDLEETERVGEWIEFGIERGLKIFPSTWADWPETLDSEITSVWGNWALQRGTDEASRWARFRALEAWSSSMKETEAYVALVNAAPAGENREALACFALEQIDQNPVPESVRNEILGAIRDQDLRKEMVEYLQAESDDPFSEPDLLHPLWKKYGVER